MAQLENLLAVLARSLVDEPDKIEVSGTETDSRVDLELRVAPDDMGRVIGRQGRTIRAIRTVVKAASVKARQAGFRGGSRLKGRPVAGESGKAPTRSGFYGHEAPAHRIVDPVPIGVVVGPHGVRGTLRVQAFGSGRHLREGMEPVVGGARRRISAARETPKGFLVDVEGVGSREAATSLKGEELLIGRGDLDPTEEGEFYVADLVGLTAIDDAGEVVGVVSDSFETAAHEVLVVRRGQLDVYVPFTLEHVPDVDLESGRVVIRPPELEPWRT